MGRNGMESDNRSICDAFKLQMPICMTSEWTLKSFSKLSVGGYASAVTWSGFQGTGTSLPPSFPVASVVYTISCFTPIESFMKCCGPLEENTSLT